MLHTALELKKSQRRLIHMTIKHNLRTGAFKLGSMDGIVRVANDFGGRVIAVMMQHKANAGGQIHGGPLHAQRRTDRRLNITTHLYRFRGRINRVE